MEPAGRLLHAASAAARSASGPQAAAAALPPSTPPPPLRSCAAADSARDRLSVYEAASRSWKATNSSTCSPWACGWTDRLPCNQATMCVHDDARDHAIDVVGLIPLAGSSAKAKTANTCATPCTFTSSSLSSSRSSGCFMFAVPANPFAMFMLTGMLILAALLMLTVLVLNPQSHGRTASIGAQAPLLPACMRHGGGVQEEVPTPSGHRHAAVRRC